MLPDHLRSNHSNIKGIIAIRKTSGEFEGRPANKDLKELDTIEWVDITFAVSLIFGGGQQLTRLSYSCFQLHPYERTFKNMSRGVRCRSCLYSIVLFELSANTMRSHSLLVGISLFGRVTLTLLFQTFNRKHPHILSTRRSVSSLQQTKRFF